MICAREASRSFLLLDFAVPGVSGFGGLDEDLWEPVNDEVKTNGFGEVDARRAERGGDGTERGFGDEQRERGRCWGEEEGSSLGGFGEALLEGAFGDVVRAMGEEDGEDSLRD